MRKNRKKIGYLLLLCIIFSLSLEFFSLKLISNSNKSINQNQINTSAQESYIKQWLENPHFTSTDNWTSSKGLLGDPNDLEANIDISEEQANFEVIGERRTKIIDDPINIANSGNWEKFNKTEPAINPDTCTIDNNGFYVSHSWHDATADQFASVYWKYNVSMDVDMSEYEITSASLNAIMYATVDDNVDTPTDTTTETNNGEQNINQPGIYDHAFFSVEIADLNVVNTYKIAYNQTNDLGRNSPPLLTYNDKQIEPYGDEQDLIYYLSKIFENDPGHDNFTIIVGIEINCEDDYTGQDYDDWTTLRIKSLNLTFTYEKKINKLSTISWNQNGAKPNDICDVNETIIVNEALLSFKYKVNETWLTESPNSEIRININDNTHSETIKLSSATTSLEDAKPEGFDVTYLIDKNKNINLSIQLYIADDFKLNRTIEISIDDVYLNISYTIIFPDYQTNLQLFLNGEDKTLITIPIGQNLTITVKYTNQTGDHISGAEIQLTGVGIIKDLKELGNNYSVSINTTQELSIGTNYLNIEATKTNFQTKLINPTIIVRKIYTEVITVSGEPTIDIDVGEDVQLEIMLNDTDNDELIRGAIITYTWDLDAVPRVLTENNGIYEGEIENPPEGLYTIRISVYADDNYEFEDFEITLNVEAYVPSPQPDLGWVIYILIGAILGLVLIFTLYQTHFKYPPMVRKIRKLKKKVQKTKKTKPILVKQREEIVKESVQSQTQFLHIDLLQTGVFKQNDKLYLKKEGEL
ncbi:MAG: hypothetical protein ACFFB8_13530 [Promethearchaeota archaeon]